MRFIKSSLSYFSEFSRTIVGGSDATMQKFANQLVNCRPFVLADIADSRESVPSEAFDKIYYLPFKVSSYEPLSPNVPDDICGWQKNTQFKQPMFIGQMLIENDDLSIDQIFLICEGAHERKVWLDNLQYVPKEICAHTYHYPSYKEMNDNESCKALLYTINDRRTIFGEVSGSVRFRKTGLTPDMVKKIIVIGSAKASTRLKNLDGLPIDWQHQWRVRGHWRKISPAMIGRDREGEYCIVGRTWVKDYVKGDGPLIEKTRIYKGENNVRSKQGNFIGPTREGPRA